MSRSGFHAWLRRGPSVRAKADETLLPKVRASFVASSRTYGARRVWRDVLAEGVACGLHRIERLMRAQALRARPRRRALPKDEGARLTSPAPNTLDRQFTAERPNQKWIADFTYVWTAEGWLYVAAVISRRMRSIRPGPVLAPRRRLVDEGRHDRAARRRRADDGGLAARQAKRPAASF